MPEVLFHNNLTSQIKSFLQKSTFLRRERRSFPKTKNDKVCSLIYRFAASQPIVASDSTHLFPARQLTSSRDTKKTKGSDAIYEVVAVLLLVQCLDEDSGRVLDAIDQQSTNTRHFPSSTTASPWLIHNYKGRARGAPGKS